MCNSGTETSRGKLKWDVLPQNEVHFDLWKWSCTESETMIEKLHRGFQLQAKD